MYIKAGYHRVIVLSLANFMPACTNWSVQNYVFGNYAEKAFNYRLLKFA